MAPTLRFAVVGLLVIAFFWMFWGQKTENHPQHQSRPQTVPLSASPAKRDHPITPPKVSATDHRAKDALKPFAQWMPDPMQIDARDFAMRRAGGTLDQERKLTATALRHFELNSSQESRINAFLDQAFTHAAEAMKKRVVAINPSRPGHIGDGVATVLGEFRIPADPNSAKAILTALLDNLTVVAGREIGPRIFNSLDLYSYFGGMGMLDTTVQFTDFHMNDSFLPKDQEFVTTYSVKARDFESGQIRMTRGGNYSDIESYFGKDTFKIEK